MSNGPRNDTFKMAGRGMRLAILTFVSALLLAFPSQLASRSVFYIAIPLLVVIIFIGIMFDMLGVAAAVADEIPFNAMASKKVPGARHGLRILRNVSTVSSFSSDFVGDIVGTLTGALGIALVLRIGSTVNPGVAEALAVAFVAALTVGGKGVGKELAIKNATLIVQRAGLCLYWIETNLGIAVLPDSSPRRKGK